MGSASLGGGEKGGVRRVELEAQGRRTVSGQGNLHRLQREEAEMSAC
jgi:hypothetical protein